MSKSPLALLLAAAMVFTLWVPTLAVPAQAAAEAPAAATAFG